MFACGNAGSLIRHERHLRALKSAAPIVRNVAAPAARVVPERRLRPSPLSAELWEFGYTSVNNRKAKKQLIGNVLVSRG